MPPWLFLTHSLRFLRATWCGIETTLDYKYSFRGLTRGSPEYRALMPSVNQRTADRLLKLCKSNRGVFIKAGQYIASLNNVLPTEFTATLAALQDKADFVSFDNVEKVFQKDLGKHPTELFSEFDRNPIAAASLAQVHVAKLKETGEKVAVKVQYIDMEDMFRGDLFTITTVMKCVGFFFPHFQFSWVLPEFAQSLKEELDFNHEGKNAEKTAAFFEGNNMIHIPKIHWDLSTKRILTMEFCDGVKVNDIPALRAAKLDLHDVARTLIDVFSDQIFVYGFIHADPHPGNILVRKTKRGATQIVLLDHGLYKELPETIRFNYSRLWRALILRDEAGIERHSRALGAGDYYNLLSIILTYRPIQNHDVGLGQSISKTDMDHIKQVFKSGTTWQDSFKIVNELLESVPRELLFILRTTNLLRSINKDLGATVNRFMVMAEHSLRGIYVNRSRSLVERIQYTWTWIEFKCILSMANFSRWALASVYGVYSMIVAFFTEPARPSTI